MARSADALATAGPAARPAGRWHASSAPAVLQQLATSGTSGLSSNEAAARLERHGPNEIREPEGRTPWRMLLDQFSDLMIVVLVAAAIVAGSVGETSDAIAIMVIVLLNGLLGFAQEYRAHRAMAALRRLAAATARVVRDGSVRDLPAALLVPGDVVVLEAGNVVPADLRLVETFALKVEEAALTGEAVPVEKTAAAIADEALALGDRINMAYRSTAVAHGRGVGVVVATGMQTELGRIAAMLQGSRTEKTPLQRRLARFGRWLAAAAAAICATVFVLGLLRGEPVLHMFLTAVSLAVAAIPEALPAVVTIALALGARRMVAQHALIRRLPAVETLGSVTFVCADKTGTLTQNRMHVEALHVRTGRLLPSEPLPACGGAAEHLLRALALNNDAQRTADGAVRGEPTETALLEAALAFGRDPARLAADAPRVGELPFDAERKCMTTLHRADASILVYTKGAPEHVLARCSGWWPAQGAEAFDAADVSRTAEAMAAAGMRVIAFAARRLDALPADLSSDAVESELLLLGLAGLIDPPRPEAAQAVAMCRSAGITPVMVTGDHPATARAIATRLGILGKGDGVLTGRELAELSPEELRRVAPGVRVYARVDPAQKIAIVAALQARGELVAMTGDGVNDAPALGRAEIGVAMGRIGTDVAREAADMVLLDDDFATIVAAVREGRRIFDNILKFIRYTMTGNSGEIWTIFLAPLLGMPIPLAPIHILWVNLVTDGLPGLALAAEPAERRVMQRRPRPLTQSVFANGMWQHIVWVGLLVGGVTLLAQAWALRSDVHAPSMAFTVLTFAQLAHVLAIRSETESLFAIGPFSNRLLAATFLGTAALQVATLYVPFMNEALQTQPLPAHALALAFALASVVFVGVELEKLAIRRGWLPREG
ncbi:MAG: cation-translocating P-type ATPase [Acidobacteria bacterium]|nr:cation-translocating P-type ATPase [Acidobacteriota bacterium]